jgi:hypothetical protein
MEYVHDYSVSRVKSDLFEVTLQRQWDGVYGRRPSDLHLPMEVSICASSSSLTSPTMIRHAVHAVLTHACTLESLISLIRGMLVGGGSTWLMDGRHSINHHKHKVNRDG